VRCIFHKLRSLAIENFNEQFKGIFDSHGQVPTKGLSNTRRFALGAILVYQLVLWYRFEHGVDLRAGLEEVEKVYVGSDIILKREKNLLVSPA
jgi:hypothetical protein